MTPTLYADDLAMIRYVQVVEDDHPMGIKQQSVPWCDEHEQQWRQSGCLVGNHACRLRDPHADNAVWKDTP